MGTWGKVAAVVVLVGILGSGWAGQEPAAVSSSAMLGLLPDGVEKRRFILDCTGCHQLTPEMAFPGGHPRPEADWRGRVEQMIGFAGAHTPFPVISAERDPERTARWLVENLRAPAEPMAAPTPARPAELREFDYPYPQDLPHDLAVDHEGGIWITGMFTHRLLRLDPATGRYDEEEIPVQGANPRAIDVADDGTVWVLLGAPEKMARYDPASGRWQDHDIGMYPHSIVFDDADRVWFNGHFTRDPERIGFLEVGTGEVRYFDVPITPELAAGGGPMPYGLRLAPNGDLWGTELLGNRVFRFRPDAEEFDLWDMPTPHSGPRRLDVAADGTVWIPEYANNSLARFDPGTRTFTEYPLPIPDALPYVARVDNERGVVWIGTGGADAVLAFEPATERFDVYPTPTRGALIRHIDIDLETGDLWAAYGASPGIPPKILRVRRGEWRLSPSPRPPS